MKISKPVLSFLSAITGGLAVVGVLQFSSLGQQNQAPPEIRVDSTPLNREASGVGSYAPVIRKAAPSVVNIFSERTVPVRPQMNPLFEDPFFRRFFGDPEQQPRERRARSLGSGVIVSQDGYILTANHVIEGADEIRVAFASGGAELIAKVIGADPPTDVAILKVEGNELPAITLADSDQLEVGDVVLAIGNPLGVGQTVTSGIISGLGRTSLGITEYENFIQTDASINRGNSGGALVDAAGRLIGLNTAILSPSGGNIGIGFAVPVNMARQIMDRIIQHGKFTRGYLGISLQPEITSDLARMFKLPDQSGAMVGGVQPDTPAAQAGLLEGDVIREVNGRPVADSSQLRLMISSTPPGSKVTLRVLRDGKERTINAKLGELPEERTVAGRIRPQETPAARSNLFGGVEVTDLESRMRRQFNIPNNIRGALITTVEPGTPAANAGLRPGDVIVDLDRKPVRNANDAIQLSRKVEGDQVLVRIWREGGTRYFVVDTSRK